MRRPFLWPAPPPDPPMALAIATEPHARVVVEVARALDVDVARGLSADEAAARLLRVGANQLEAHEPPSVWRSLFGAATEPFVLLLAAAGIGAVLLGEVRDGLLVLCGLIPIVAADVATTYRSERALAELREAVAPVAHVMRDGVRIEVPAGDIVPGDVLLLATGDVVPADARVLPGGDLLVDRSVLTGESVPEQTKPSPDADGAPLTDRHAMVYAGTSIVGGRGPALVVATGSTTELGAIASNLTAPQRRRSPLQRELYRLVRILLVAAIALIVVTVGLGFLRGQPARCEPARGNLRRDRCHSGGAAGPAGGDPRSRRVSPHAPRRARSEAGGTGITRRGGPHHHRQDRHPDAQQVRGRGTLAPGSPDRCR